MIRDANTTANRGRLCESPSPRTLSLRRGSTSHSESDLAGPEHVGAHPGELKYSVADIHGAQRELGHAPRGELARDLDAVVQWCRDQATAAPTQDQSR